MGDFGLLFLYFSFDVMIKMEGQCVEFVYVPAGLSPSPRMRRGDG